MEPGEDKRLKQPDGLADAVVRRGLWHRHASPITLLLLGTLLVLACAGVFGGQPSPRSAVNFGRAALTVQTPTVIRNGELFETDIMIRAAAPIDNAVLAVDADLWRDLTINTMIPAPAEEDFKESAFRFSFGPLAAGETIRIKIDGQVNPPLFAGTAGGIAIYDGERLIGRQPVRIRVLP